VNSYIAVFLNQCVGSEKIIFDHGRTFRVMPDLDLDLGLDADPKQTF